MLRAILFDLDGTLVDNNPLHFQSWRQMLADYDLDIDETFYKQRISGRLNSEIVLDLLPMLAPDEVQRVIEQKESHYRTLARQLTLLPGLAKLFVWASERRLALGLVTNAPRQNTQFVLEILSLEDTFAKVVLAEDVAAGKPDPIPYQVALKHLDVSPADALAFEDSPSGIRSAVEAGIATVGIASTHEVDQLYRAGAELVVPDFADSRLWTLLQDAN